MEHSFSMTFFLMQVFLGLLAYIWCLCPIRHFFRDMPKKILKRGKFRPYAYRVILNIKGAQHFSKGNKKTLLMAYLTARLIAWKLDFCSLGQENGVCWGIPELSE